MNISNLAAIGNPHRSFAVAGPRVWNSLPAHLRDEDIPITAFWHELKT